VNRSQRDSLVNPSRACITASVTSSASEICGGESDRRAPRRALQQIIGPDIECGREGVQIGVHEGLRVRRWVKNADLGHPSRITVTARQTHTPWNRSSRQ
jgi:hypothetical protein